MLVNKYISDTFKQKLEDAIKSSELDKQQGDICGAYKCTMVFLPKAVQPKTDPKKRYFIRTFDNVPEDKRKGKEYRNQTDPQSHQPKESQTINKTEKVNLHDESAKSNTKRLKKHVSEANAKERIKNEVKHQIKMPAQDAQIEHNPYIFGHDPRFPPFPTFPSFPSFPEFPEHK